METFTYFAQQKDIFNRSAVHPEKNNLFLYISAADRPQVKSNIPV